MATCLHVCPSIHLITFVYRPDTRTTAYERQMGDILDKQHQNIADTPTESQSSGAYIYPISSLA